MAQDRQRIQPKSDSLKVRLPDKPSGGARATRFHKIEAKELELTVNLRRFVAFSLLGIITLNTIVTLTAIYLVGFGLMHLSDKIIFTLLAQTVAQIAATFLTVIKFLFPSKSIPKASVRQIRNGASS